MNDTPRTSAALGATLEAGWDLGPQHRALTELCRELERENVMLAQRPSTEESEVERRSGGLE